MITHRARILTALKHQQPDRVPMDLGSTIATTMTAPAHASMRAYLGLPAEPPPADFVARAAMVIPDEVILRRLDVDARPLLLGSPDATPERDVAQGVKVDGDWKTTWVKHAGTHYIVTDGPFFQLENPTLADLEKFPWPDPSDLGRYRTLRARAKKLHDETDYAVILNLGNGPTHQCQFVRGYSQFLEDLLIRPSFAEALMDRTVDFFVQVADRALQEAGEYIDLCIFGEDIGTQNTPLFRPELYRRMLKPRHRRMVEAIKRHGKPVIHHTCGSVYALIPDLIDVGIDALNPIQVSAAEMDTKRLKQEFGRDLTFWGGIDTHKVLPFGTPTEVREEVKRRIGDLGDGGGYVLAAVHNIQAEVPPENVIAMFEVALEFGN